jgi:hypothetical protein
VSYFRPWFLWPETKKLVIPFLRICLIAILLSVHCVSPHRRFHKPRRISTLKTKYHLLWLPPWPQPIVENGSSIQGRSMVSRLKISSIFLSLRMDHQFKEDRWCQDWRFQVSFRRKSISGTYLISITSLPEDEQTSKHGGGGRYNAILEFKGSK